VIQVDPGVLRFKTHAPLDVDEVLWATTALPPAWLQDTDLPLDEKGFIQVEPSLLVKNTDDVFAAGDVMTLEEHPISKTCAHAVHSGSALAENIFRLAMGKRLKNYKPPHNLLHPITVGNGLAVGTRNGMVSASKGMWRRKGRTDVRFVEALTKLPAISVEEKLEGLPAIDEKAERELSGDGIRCGGAGAKVGPAVLGRALGRIKPLKRPEVLAGIEASEDSTVTDLGNELLQVQSVDYFRTMIDDPFLFGKISANHALSDIFAMGANPETALAIVSMPFGLAQKTEADLTALLKGANEVLAEAGCSLVGGHTAESAEFGLGLAVTGVVPRERILHKSAAKTGDLLILTKPLGTGTLLAAHMRGKAKGQWMLNAIRHMLQSNRAASSVFLRHGVHAVTDVGGFGLLGHLVEMLRASKTAAVLRLKTLKVLPGTTETLEAQIFSSVHQQNLWMRRVIRRAENLAHPLYPALFDPQTGGGLLAAAPPPVANAVVSDLVEAGYRHTAIIGEITASDGAAELVSLRI
jgi:selenide,water dikinase